MRWETEWPFDGKLCQEYLYQKLLKSDNWFSSYSRKCWGCFFGTQCTYSTARPRSAHHIYRDIASSVQCVIKIYDIGVCLRRLDVAVGSERRRKFSSQNTERERESAWWRAVEVRYAADVRLISLRANGPTVGHSFVLDRYPTVDRKRLLTASFMSLPGGPALDARVAALSFSRRSLRAGTDSMNSLTDGRSRAAATAD